MIVYRDAGREEQTAAKLERLRRLAARGDAEGFLLEAGELEQGAADALAPRCDDWGVPQQLLRDLLRAAGAAYVAGLEGRCPASALLCAAGILPNLRRLSASDALPARLRVKPPEGYVHYALDPAGYAAAATAYRTEVGAVRAARALVLGIRTVGTSLSAVVAAVVGSERTATLRPRGETGARRVIAGPAFEARLLAWLAGGADVLVVDEGPGATGETLAAVAAWLRGLGVADHDIVLVASRAWGMPLAPEDRRSWFERARKHVPPLGDPRPGRLASMLGLSKLQDLSGGRWREVVPGTADEPACVAHERSKYRAWDNRGRAYLIRYVGMGRWGAPVIQRAEALAEAGAGPAVLACAHGFVVCDWAEGQPPSGNPGRDRRFVAALASYVRTRAGRFPTGRAVEIAPLVELLVQNASEALGANAAGLAATARRLERLPRAEAVVADARIQRREWLCTQDSYRKVDALDHGDGLRFPGPTHAAWDVAGAAIEFDLDDEVTADLARQQAAASGGAAASFIEAATTLRAPYAACALGDALLSAREAPAEEDQRRFEAQAERYGRALDRELRRAA